MNRKVGDKVWVVLRYDFNHMEVCESIIKNILRETEKYVIYNVETNHGLEEVYGTDVFDDKEKAVAVAIKEMEEDIGFIQFQIERFKQGITE